MLSVLFLLSLSIGAAPIESRELIQDPDFSQGFKIYAPKSGAHVVQKELQFTADSQKPIWGIAQWGSKHTLADYELEKLSGDTYQCADPAKRFRYTPPGTLSLAIDSRQEYGDTPRIKGQPWPHLLASQQLDAPPRLNTLSAMPFYVECRLVHSETFKPEGYTPKLHAAQYQIFFTVQNRNKENPGFGDFLWLGVSIYDDRGRVDGAVVKGDVAHSKLIYTPPRTTYTDQPVKVGEWITFQADLLPIAKDALAEAWKHGFLKNSQDLADYQFNGMNLGWEVPGMNKVEVDLRGISLLAVNKEPSQ